MEDEPNTADDDPDAAVAPSQADPVYAAPAPRGETAPMEAFRMEALMSSPTAPSAADARHVVASATHVDIGLPEMRFGPRELTVLGLGVLAMVMIVMLVAR